MNKKAAKKVKFDDDNYLLLKLNHFNIVYGVTITLEQESKTPQYLSFEMHLKARKFPEAWSIEVDRQDLYFNHQIPNKPVDELGYQCGQSMYPVELIVNNDWQITGVRNYDQIRERWIKLRKELSETYQDEIAEWYLNATDKNMTNPRMFMKAIRQNLFLSFFFMPIYKRYIPFVNTRNEKVRIPILPHTLPVEYSVLQEVIDHYTAFDTISIIQKGQLSDERSDYDLTTRKDIPLSGNVSNTGPLGMLETRLELDKDTGIIESIIADCDIQLPFGQSRSLHMEVYHLKERDSKEDKNSSNHNSYE